jgi:hypothetical protein
MQASQRVSVFQCHQPPASIALCSRRRRFAVAQGVQRGDPGPEIARIWRMSVSPYRKSQRTLLRSATSLRVNSIPHLRLAEKRSLHPRPNSDLDVERAAMSSCAFVTVGTWG